MAAQIIFDELLEYFHGDDVDAIRELSGEYAATAVKLTLFTQAALDATTSTKIHWVDNPDATERIGVAVVPRFIIFCTLKPTTSLTTYDVMMSIAPTRINEMFTTLYADIMDSEITFLRTVRRITHEVALDDTIIADSNEVTSYQWPPFINLTSRHEPMTVADLMNQPLMLSANTVLIYPDFAAGRLVRVFSDRCFARIFEIGDIHGYDLQLTASIFMCNIRRLDPSADLFMATRYAYQMRPEVAVALTTEFIVFAIDGYIARTLLHYDPRKSIFIPHGMTHTTLIRNVHYHKKVLAAIDSLLPDSSQMIDTVSEWGPRIIAMVAI